MRRLFLLLAVSLAISFPAAATEMHFGDIGLEIDQSVTERWFQGDAGERANIGVLAVTDRPWQPMLDEMIKTNYGIYQVLLGKEKPFVFEDPRFKNTP